MGECVYRTLFKCEPHALGISVCVQSTANSRTVSTLELIFIMLTTYLIHFLCPRIHAHSLIHTHTHTSLLTHVHTCTCTHAAAPDGSGSHNVSSVRTGSDAVWACPTTGSPSYGRGSPGSAIKDQSTTHRMPHHDHSTSSSSTQPNHSFQQARNQFEEEVAGSLDQALKQLFS